MTSLRVALFVVLAAAASAAVHDPFLADLRIGRYRDPAAIAIEDGWPAGLLAPIELDTAWVAAAGVLDRGPTPPGWRLIVPTLGESREVVAWYDAERQARSLLTAVAAGADSAASVTAEQPLAAEILMLAGSRAWQAGRDAQAAAIADRLVRERAALGLDDETAFGWDLRSRCLRARAGMEAVAGEGVWPRLNDLGSYDVRSGWALWVACRRAAGQPVLPPGFATRELGLALATGGEAFVNAAQLHDAGFPADVEAGLGAIVLPSAELADFFTRQPIPPADGLLQGYWLRGQRRRHPGDGAWYEKLAATAALSDGHRLDTWRLASEARILAGEWTPGLRDLQAGLRLMSTGASRAMRRKLRDWTVKSLVLAQTRGRAQDAREVLRLARAHLTGEDAEIFQREAAPWLIAVDPAAPRPAAAATRQARAEAVVIAGQAAPVGAAAAAIPAATATRDELWLIWARLGETLLAGSPAADALRAVASAPDAGQRDALACAAVGRTLAGKPWVERVRRYVLATEIQAAGGDAVAPAPSVVPQLLADAACDLPSRHALLGLAIATGDMRGQLAAAGELPLDALAEVERLRLQYPLPATNSTRDALVRAAVGADLVLAVARNESLFEPAVRSRAGALGFMQIMPFHYDAQARRPGRANWRQPAVSIAMGAGLLAGEARRFGGDPYRTVAAYNAGAGAVQRWDRQLGRADRAAFLAWIGYDETRRYVAAVLTDREIYRWLLAEAAP